MNLGLLTIKGQDAKKFLQGQLTCNMDNITAGQAQLAAHCNQQGRIISLFHITIHADDYHLIMPANMTPIAMAALKKYAVFYKVVLEEESIATQKIMEDDLLLPVVYPETSGKFLPHELNLDKLDAISFDKGCYTGQEIIARMHYRGKLKKHLYQAKVNVATPPVPGDEVYCELNNEVSLGGTIVRSEQRTNNEHDVLLVCEDDYAKNDCLFLGTESRTYLAF